MPSITNFDRLKDIHAEARRCGTNSRAWIEFACTMMDSFPLLYETAKRMNAAFNRQLKTEDALRNLLAQIELHTDCMSGLIESESLADFVEEAEESLRTSSAWKNVDEELPDADTTVLVCTKDCAEPVWIGYLDGDIWRDIDSLPINVTHWCHLPTPAEAAV